MKIGTELQLTTQGHGTEVQKGTPPPPSCIRQCLAGRGGGESVPSRIFAQLEND